MPWKETKTVDERVQFIVAIAEGDHSVASLCRQFGISRRIGYKWMVRYEEEGPAGLIDHSRAPHHPLRLAPEVEEAILAARRRHPTWGPKKLLVVLARRGIALPARSTVGAVLHRYGLAVPPKHRRRVPAQEHPFAACQGSNATWCIDFKGWFYTADGQRCDPLTITDAWSRYLLRCQGLAQTGYVGVRLLLEAAFREYGLPEAIRSDNGSPFASRAIAGLSELSVWWVKLGIRPERIEPGQPQQNGRHERMHLTLKKETADPPAGTLRRQQERFDTFRREFNEERPHEALGMATPASLYVPSPRQYPERLNEPEYPAGWTLRRVDSGRFRWQGDNVFLSHVLHGELVGLKPLDERHWQIWFGPMALGIFDGYEQSMLTPRAAKGRGLDAWLFRSSFRCAPGASEQP